MRTARPEVMLRRLTVDEALEKLDKFLTQSYTGGWDSVRVIHGKGTGTLRLEVRRELGRHPRVRSFQDAEPNEGGAGATIAFLSRK